jgi:hypothetical protein
MKTLAPSHWNLKSDLFLHNIGRHITILSKRLGYLKNYAKRYEPNFKTSSVKERMCLRTWCQGEYLDRRGTARKLHYKDGP